MTADRFRAVVARIDAALAEDPAPGMPLDTTQLTALVGEHDLDPAEYAAWLDAASDRLRAALAEEPEPADAVAAARATAAVCAVAVLIALTLAGALVGAVRLTYRRWRP